MAVGLGLSGCFSPSPGLRAVIRTDPNPPRGPYPLTVTFDGSASLGTVQEWVWSIFRLEGDGEALLDVLCGNQVQYTFRERGTYRVRLEVRSGTSLDQEEVLVDVRSKPPVAALTATPTYVQEGQVVQFDAGGSRDEDGIVVRYLWDFGDGYWAETTNPETTHRYQKAGQYEARLVVEDDYGDRSEKPASLRITVYPKGCGSCP